MLKVVAREQDVIVNIVILFVHAFKPNCSNLSFVELLNVVEL